MVNDYKDQQDGVTSDLGLLECKNHIVLLVSATPYNVLSRTSRIPEKFVITHAPPVQVDQDRFNKLKPQSVLEQDG